MLKISIFITIITIVLVILISNRKELSAEQSGNYLNSPQNYKSKIAFAANKDGERELYVMDPDGSNVKRITNNTVPGHAPTEKNPSWSADGSKLMYISDPEFHGWMSIFITDIEGKKHKRITGKPRSKDASTWGAHISPDGSKAAFVSKRTSNWELYVINTDGTGIRNISNSNEDEDSPSWSPDSKRIVYSADKGGKSNIYIINADGSNKRKITDSGSSWTPSLSTDGKQIAFISDDDIYIMSIDGSSKKRITKTSKEEKTPSWSPDGKMLAYVLQEGWKPSILIM